MSEAQVADNEYSMASPTQEPADPKADAHKQRLERAAYDADVWLSLVQEAKQAQDDNLLYETYSRALTLYPSSGYLLSGYVELELGRGNKEKAESIFNENLFIAPSLEFWLCYLNYVRKSNRDSSGAISQPESRATVTNCYKLVLDNVGGDRDAGQIWIDYIEFLNSSASQGQYDDQLRAMQVREAYQKAVAIPLAKVEEIWKSYDSFENSLNRGAAKKFLSETSSAYMTARTALREMNRFWDVIRKTSPPHDLPRLPGWSPREISLLDAWKQYIRWEISNPLRLESTEALQKRVIYAYNQACMPLRFYPEIWIEFADYLWSIGQRDEALPKMRDACDVLPTSLSVHFTYAEMAEKLKQTTKCKQIYDRVVNTARSEIDNTTSKYTGRLDKLNRKLRELSSPDIHNQGSAGAAEAESQVEQLDEILSEPESGLDDVSDSMSVAEDDKLDRAEPEGSGQQPASQSSTNKLKRSIERRISKVRQRMDASLSEQRETYTLAWIMYLRFVRRSEGIDAARQLLRRPRSDPPGYLTYHLFVAAAQMEYHVGKRADVAGRLFEYYSKNYSDQKDYILHYLRFLIDSSNDSNARALFERFHNQSVGDTKEMWDLFADYEYNYGDISSITNLDKRYIDKFSDETAITRISAKYSYLDMESVSLRDFGLNHRYGGRGADMPRRHVGSEQAGEDENYRPRGDLPASAGQLGGIHNVGVGSITGRSLNKRQLMAPVRSSRFAKPLVADLEVYAPTIEPMPEPTPEAAAAGALGMGPANPGTVSPYQRLLNSGDVLSYAASSLAASSTSEFDGYPLDTDALLDALMSSPVPGPLASSDYRPLEYLITLKRQRFQQPSGFDGPHSRREKAGGLEVGGRARARGNDLPPGHRSHAHPSKHPRSGSSSRGAHRQAPYARSPVYSRNDSRSRSPYRGSRNSGRGGH